MSKGKFSGSEAEALYAVAAVQSDWVGSDEFGVSAALVILDAAEAEQFSATEGIFIVSETADGFVDVEFFDDESEARGALASIEADYADWYLPETAPDYQEG